MLMRRAPAAGVLFFAGILFAAARVSFLPRRRAISLPPRRVFLSFLRLGELRSELPRERERVARGIPPFLRRRRRPTTRLCPLHPRRRGCVVVVRVSSSREPPSASDRVRSRILVGGFVGVASSRAAAAPVTPRVDDVLEIDGEGGASSSSSFPRSRRSRTSVGVVVFLTPRRRRRRRRRRRSVGEGVLGGSS